MTKLPKQIAIILKQFCVNSKSIYENRTLLKQFFSPESSPWHVEEPINKHDAFFQRSNFFRCKSENNYKKIYFSQTACFPTKTNSRHMGWHFGNPAKKNRQLFGNVLCEVRKHIWKQEKIEVFFFHQRVSLDMWNKIFKTMPIFFQKSSLSRSRSQNNRKQFCFSKESLFFKKFPGQIE